MATNSARRYPLQISLRTLLAAMAALSVCLLIGTKVGVVEGCGVAVTMILAVIFVALKGHREAWVLRPFVAVVASVILWMVSVDYVRHFTGCRICSIHWVDREIRVFHFTVASFPTKRHPALESQIITDLGLTCPHQFDRNFSARVWGIFLYCPSFRSYTCSCFFGRDWENPNYRERVRQLLRDDPSIAQEFQERMITNRDRAWFLQFLKKVNSTTILVTDKAIAE